MILSAPRAPTSGSDSIQGTALANTIYLLSGNDSCDGLGGSDRIYGGDGRDVIYGGTGDDRLFGGTSADQLFGGSGNDILFGDTGADIMAGWLGNDIYWVDSTQDRVQEAAGAGRDVIYSTVSLTIRGNVEELRLSGSANLSATGDSRANVLVGNGGNNRLSAGDGADNLNGGSGNDTIYGGLGADLLLGGSGLDDLRGGAGADQLNGGQSFDILRGGIDTQRDVFIFSRIADSRPLGPIDVIFDFRSGIDRVDLLGINANQSAAGAHLLAYSGTQAAAYSVWWYNSGGNVILSADTSGNGTADFAVRIAATLSLAAGDVLL